MINKLFAVIFLSVIVVFFPQYTAQFMSWILSFHSVVVDFLATIFSDGEVGRFIRDFLGLMTLPLLLGLVPVIVYWILKRRIFNYFMLVVWSFWLLQLGAIVVLHKI